MAELTRGRCVAPDHLGGEEWYAYFMRRLAERPVNTAFFARSLLTRG
ncbi:hypothetical protein [Halostreptopolyspora alba]